ncbi:hypothetical protein D1007_14087 [Hordeum vulgare]|nr:hypothetical protein D1007_14087 [Hordeum vulgare]
MSSTMWVWREELFKLSAMPSLPITAAPLRHIYGEEDLAIPALKPSDLSFLKTKQKELQVYHFQNQKNFRFITTFMGADARLNLKSKLKPCFSL